jgi:putative membrane protein
VISVLRFLLKVVVLAVTFVVVARYVPGIHVEENPTAPLHLSITYLWLALLFAVINAVLRPVLKVVSLPLVLATFGLFLLVMYVLINAAVLGLTAALSTRLQIDGFTAALVGGFVLALVSWVFDLLFSRD